MVVLGPKHRILERMQSEQGLLFDIDTDGKLYHTSSRMAGFFYVSTDGKLYHTSPRKVSSMSFHNAGAIRETSLQLLVSPMRSFKARLTRVHTNFYNVAMLCLEIMAILGALLCSVIPVGILLLKIMSSKIITWHYDCHDIQYDR